ncbi:MAG TPA: hypothetical protein PKO33_06825, partial [Pyrinomonadaceae bacterium]|nr:hypothetical protein [Pyrinomonadaceae bacterium]
PLRGVTSARFRRLVQGLIGSNLDPGSLPSRDRDLFCLRWGARIARLDHKQRKQGAYNLD